MYLVIATVESNDYYYGPYPTREDAESVVEAAENRKGDRAPDMRVVYLQSNDGFLLGNAARTYSGFVRFDRV